MLFVSITFILGGCAQEEHAAAKNHSFTLGMKTASIQNGGLERCEGLDQDHCEGLEQNEDKDQNEAIMHSGDLYQKGDSDQKANLDQIGCLEREANSDERLDLALKLDSQSIGAYVYNKNNDNSRFEGFVFGIVDRFEEGYVVIEIDGQTMDVPSMMMDGNVVEGDVVQYQKRLWIRLPCASIERTEYIHNLINRIWVE